MAYADDQKFEQEWWGDCLNTFGEETKQITYAHRMGLVNQPQGGHWPVYDVQGKKILDIGGGPASMLLKCINLAPYSVVVDPCDYPDWVTQRYALAGIIQSKIPAEEIYYRPGPLFDEVWIYNCLQHVMDPQKIIENARESLVSGGVIRLFEWVFESVSIGHPHELFPAMLNAWLGGQGTVERMDENGCVGMAYYGVFG